MDPDDLEVIGYPLEDLWKPLESASEGPNVKPKAPSKLSRYRIQRALIVGLRGQAQKGGMFQNVLRKLQLGLDVILRE